MLRLPGAYLSDVCEDGVYHAHEHPVLERMPGVLDDGDDVGAGLGHVDQVAAGAVRELDGVDAASGAHDVGHMGNRRACVACVSIVERPVNLCVVLVNSMRV